MDIVNGGYEMFQELRGYTEIPAKRHAHFIRTIEEEGRQAALDWMVEWS